MGTIRFFLRPDKKDKDSKRPIELAYQISKKRVRFITKERAWPEYWDQENQKAIYLDKKMAKEKLPGKAFNELPTAKEIESLNNNLNSLVILIRNAEKRKELDNVTEYSPKEIVDVLRKQKPQLKNEIPTNNVFEYIDRYIQEHKAIREPGSLQVYSSLKNHLLAFQKQRGYKITFSDLDTSFFLKFQIFLATPRKEKTTVNKKQSGKNKIKPQEKFREIILNNTTIAKQLSTLKTFIGYARAAGVQVTDKYRDFKIKKENLEVIALTNDEFEKLIALDLSGNKKLDQIRDVLCFSCTTGLRYSDLKQLKRENIKGDEITITVKKTKEPHKVPLNTYSHFILEKYKKFFKPLPVISNQKTNEYIKELCLKAEINEPVEIVRFRGPKRDAITYPKHELVSIHTGRKTFATLSLEKGMSAEETMEIGGWTDYKSFKRYVKVTEQRKKVVMLNAWGEIKIPKFKAV